MTSPDLRVKLFADGADLSTVRKLAADPSIAGCFTPTTEPYGFHIYTLFAFLLPYVEQDNVFKTMTTGGYAGGHYMRVVPTYLCPTDPSIHCPARSPLSPCSDWRANGFRARCATAPR